MINLKDKLYKQLDMQVYKQFYESILIIGQVRGKVHRQLYWQVNDQVVRQVLTNIQN